MRLVFVVAVIWLVLVGTYLLFAGSVDTLEIAFGLVCSTAAAFLAVAMSRIAKLHFAFALNPKVLYRPLVSLPADFLALGRELLLVIRRGSTNQVGDFIHQPFRIGGLDEASATRRAAVLIALSFTPRSFFVRNDEEGLLMHSIPAGKTSDDLEWPL